LLCRKSQRRCSRWHSDRPFIPDSKSTQPTSITAEKIDWQNPMTLDKVSARVKQSLAPNPNSSKLPLEQPRGKVPRLPRLSPSTAPAGTPLNIVKGASKRADNSTKLEDPRTSADSIGSTGMVLPPSRRRLPSEKVIDSGFIHLPHSRRLP
jgi:hypothetical protein